MENDIELFWTKINERDCLRFKFGKQLSRSEAELAIKQWKEAFQSHNTGRKTDLVWDCSELKDYEPMARVVWQSALKELGGQIGKIWLISPSKIIRAGASMMSLFTKFAIKAVPTQEAIEMRVPV